MLRRLGFYAGPPTGSITAALRAFQQARNLTVDGGAGVATWIELIRQFQNALVPAALADARFHANAVFGCGEAYPVMPLGDNREAQQNRRVEVIFRTNPVNPVDNTLVGAAVPYPDWLAPEVDVDPGAASSSVVVALTDSGLGRGAADNWSGDLSHQMNPLQIRGERMVRPTSTGGAGAAAGAAVAVSNLTPAVVNADGNLGNVNDGPAPPGSGIGHGSAVMTCLAA
jgi:peptidoglycan hydrolase-like protein with peptidoglycan-binding domain